MRVLVASVAEHSNSRNARKAGCAGRAHGGWERVSQAAEPQRNPLVVSHAVPGSSPSSACVTMIQHQGLAAGCGGDHRAPAADEYGAVQRRI